MGVSVGGIHAPKESEATPGLGARFGIGVRVRVRVRTRVRV